MKQIKIITYSKRQYEFQLRIQQWNYMAGSVIGEAKAP